MVDIDKRLHEIILECQEIRENDIMYPEGDDDKLDKFSKEIIENKLTEKSVEKYFARQLCIMNELGYDQ